MKCDCCIQTDGVERSTIMEDYLLTNHVNAAKSERYYQNPREKTGGNIWMNGNGD